MKTRVIGLNQQLLRIDHDNTNYLESHQEAKFINKLKEVKDLSAILISDYAKGTITKQLMSQLITYSKNNNIPIIIDPKPKHQEWYTGSTLITPNKKEAQEMSGMIFLFSFGKGQADGGLTPVTHPWIAVAIGETSIIVLGEHTRLFTLEMDFSLSHDPDFEDP